MKKIKPLVKKLSLLTKGFPICEKCGEPISYSNMKFHLNKNELIIDIPARFEQRFKNNIFHISKCLSCTQNKFGDDLPSMQRYLFMIKTRWGQFIYNIPTKLHKEIRSDKCGVTLKSLTNKYGKEEGEKRWKHYCEIQGEVNTFEYKKKKFGWTKEQFEQFNLSRACTLENFINRYGEIKGKEKWDTYINKQIETKSWEYMVNKFGEERALEINKSKVSKNGVANLNYYSKISQKLFNELDVIIKKDSFYASKNHEYILNDNNKLIMLDYYIPELKLNVEFDGDLWHANPNKFNKDDKPVPFSDMTAEEIWNHDKERQKFVESQGIRVVRIWESEYNDKNFDINKFISNKLKIKTEKSNL